VDWRHRAACVGQDGNLFFPLSSTEASDAVRDRAKEVCGGCPVRQPCLDWALEVGVDDGIFGGLTARERRTLKRRSHVTSNA
jgi:WhiB family redox-sensing transcriptional regulator